MANVFLGGLHPFDVVGFEQTGIGLALHYSGKLPGKVFGILNAGLIVIYDAAADAFQMIPGAGNDWFKSSATLNRDGTLIASRRDNAHNSSIDTLPDAHFVRSFSGIDGVTVFSKTRS